MVCITLNTVTSRGKAYVMKNRQSGGHLEKYVSVCFINRKIYFSRLENIGIHT